MRGKKSLCREFCNYIMPKLCWYCFSPKIVRFQDGSNKVASALCGVQFWSEIILVTKLQSTQLPLLSCERVQSGTDKTLKL